MKLKKYNQFINESLSEEVSEDLSEDYKDIKSDLIDLIEESVNSTDIELIKDFVESFLRDPDATNIEGLINDSDVYDFYLKYTDDIDSILNDIDYFSKSPQENGIIGVYDYIVFSTRTAVEEVVKMIQSDLFGEEMEKEISEE